MKILSFLFINFIIIAKLIWAEDFKNRKTGEHIENFENTFKLLRSKNEINKECTFVNALIGEDETYDCCKRVSCDSDKHILNIFLRKRDIKNHELPESFGYMPKLETLHLYNCSLTGKIPDDIGELTSLKYVWLYHNNFTGTEIPDNFQKLTSLRILDLSENGLVGGLPSSIKYLYNLKILDFSGNNLSGEIDGDSLKGLEEIIYLFLNDNNFTGKIPKKISELVFLVYVHLQNNKFEGEIPMEIGYLSNLQAFDASNNNLSGTIPETIHYLKNLMELKLDNNNLEGVIPPRIKELENLAKLTLSNNQLSCMIPSTLTKLLNLQEINLSHNKFEGVIPEHIGNLTKLEILNLSYNQLQEEIPASVGNLTNLNELILNDNKLKGKVYSKFERLSNLKTLELSNNVGLVGSIPKLKNSEKVKPNYAGTSLCHKENETNKYGATYSCYNCNYTLVLSQKADTQECICQEEFYEVYLPDDATYFTCVSEKPKEESYSPKDEICIQYDKDEKADISGVFDSFSVMNIKWTKLFINFTLILLVTGILHI